MAWLTTERAVAQLRGLLLEIQGRVPGIQGPVFLWAWGTPGNMTHDPEWYQRGVARCQHDQLASVRGS